MARSRGRPQTPLVNKIRTQAWFRAVRIVSGWKTPYAIEIAIDGDELQARSATPRKCSDYAAGRKSPFDHPGKGNFIDSAEALFPGTAKWYRSPLWRMIKGDVDREFLIECLKTLDHRVVSAIFESEGYPDGERDWQIRELDDDSVVEICSIRDFDCLVAAIALARLSEMIAYPALREIALKIYSESIGWLVDLPELADVFEELFTLIDETFPMWCFLLSGERMEECLSWRMNPTSLERESKAWDDHWGPILLKWAEEDAKNPKLANTNSYSGPYCGDPA